MPGGCCGPSTIVSGVDVGGGGGDATTVDGLDSTDFVRKTGAVNEAITGEKTFQAKQILHAQDSGPTAPTTVTAIRSNAANDASGSPNVIDVESRRDEGIRRCVGQRAWKTEVPPRR